MPDTRQELTFALERFEWVEDDRLEVVGRWEGLTGRRLGRPVLHVEVDGRRRRLTATPGGHLPTASGEEWRAAFAWPHGTADVEGAELEVGRSLLVELPAPRRRKRRTPDPDVGLREENASLRAQLDELRSAEPADAELAQLRAELEELRNAEPEAEIADLRAEIEELRNAASESSASDAELRDEHKQLRAEHDLLSDRYAAIVAGTGELRGELDAAVQAQERLSEELERTRVELAEREHELAAARQEAQSAMAAEADETERLRTELTAAREEAERVLADERAETTRLREELASRPSETSSDEAGREMYEQVTRDLERERETVRNLRRELEATQMQTAEQRRTAAAAATNGDATTREDAPVAATAAGRRRSSAVGGSRAGADPRASYRRADAARAAAASRVPEHEPSTAGVWATRALAVILVAVLLGAMIVIVTALA